MAHSLVEEADSTEEAIEKLRQRHQSLEERLEELKTPRSMSPEEEQEVQKIKKRKLKLKDEMASLKDDA